MGFTTAGLTNGGKTAHFEVSYDDSFSPVDGVQRANAFLFTCEQDFAMLQSWFAGVNFNYAPLKVQIQNATGAAHWDGSTITIKPGTGTPVALIRYFLILESSEQFMASANNGWFQGSNEGSKGEGLSLFLGLEFLIANALPPVPAFLVPVWLNDLRGNFVDNAPDDPGDDETNGCTTAFIHFLHTQLGFSINQIIAAGADTLADVYTKLTGKHDAWNAFIGLINLHYPQPQTYNPATDNLFPVPNLATLDNAAILANDSQTIPLLTLDNNAPAEVVVTLTSDNPLLLEVPPSVTLGVGTWSTAIKLTAGDFIGPAQTVNIHATYAGKTLTSTVTVDPRPSVLNGHVRDSALHPINDATILIQPDAEPGFGSTLQLSTDANGFYQTPVIPPGNYQVTALQSGYVPSQASVAVNVGVPTTTQDFTLATALPFKIVGTVTDQANAPIAGATVTLDQNSPVPGQLKTQTNAAGQYSFTMNPGSFNGTYTIIASDAGYVTGSVSTTIPNGATITRNFVLAALGSLSGLVVTSGLTPVAGATVTSGLQSTKSNANGNYSLSGLTPGANPATANAAGFDSAQTTVNILAGATINYNFAMVKASAVITGTITNSDLGTPIAGATVYAGNASTSTDGNGHYTFTNLPAGQVKVTATALKFESESSTVQVKDQQTLEVDFQLTRATPVPHIPPHTPVTTNS